MTYYSDEEPEVDLLEEQDKEDKEFDKKWDELEKQRELFEESSPDGVFNCLSLSDFEKMMNGSYKPKRNYFKKIKKPDFVFPSSIQYIPHEKTEEEIIEEKKGWITFGYEKPPCGKCKICLNPPKGRGRRRRRICRNRGKQVSKPLYPELFKLKTPEPTPPPPPKTKMEEISEIKNERLKKTGNPWGKSQNTEATDLDQLRKQLEQKEILLKEEKRLQQIKDDQKKKEQEEREKQREADKQRKEERQRYFRERNDQQRNDRRQQRINRNGGSSGRFGNLW